MTFKPLNRYIEIEPETKEAPKTETGILLPSDYKVVEATHACAKVKSWDSQVRFSDLLVADCWVVVDKSMIEEVSIQGKTVNLILDNYVLGLITE